MNHRVLAHKYANAFYRLFKDICSLDLLDTLQEIATFFSHNKNALFLLNVPQVTLQIKNDALHTITQKIGLPSKINSLFMLLVAHKRASLLPQVCMQLRAIILQKNNMVECEIATTQALTASERMKLSNFFSAQIKHDIRAQYVIDKTLIAGIALRSDTYAWEHSIKKQLHTIKQSLIT